MAAGGRPSGTHPGGGGGGGAPPTGGGGGGGGRPSPPGGGGGGGGGGGIIVVRDFSENTLKDGKLILHIALTDLHFVLPPRRLPLPRRHRPNGRYSLCCM